MTTMLDRNSQTVMHKALCSNCGRPRYCLLVQTNLPGDVRWMCRRCNGTMRRRIVPLHRRRIRTAEQVVNHPA